MEIKAHLHAIDPYRYTETELVPLATFTLPEGLTCRSCTYTMALVTDGINFVSDHDASAAFARQIWLLQEALNADHAGGHPHWRYIADTAVVTPVS
jgi:hypothetical protein